jgi:hypothetical protein
VTTPSKHIPRYMALMSFMSVVMFLSMVGFGVVNFSSELDRRVVDDSMNLVSRHLDGIRAELDVLSIDYNNGDVGNR